MSALLRQYFDIAFLMGRPQDLPGGDAQMRIGIALAFVTYVIAVSAGFGRVQHLVCRGPVMGRTTHIMKANNTRSIDQHVTANLPPVAARAL